MKIYHVTETFKDELVEDADSQRLVRVRHPVMQESALDKLHFGDKTFEVGEDGSFEVPDEIGQFFVGPLSVAVGWHAGVSPFPRAKTQVPAKEKQR